VLAVAVATSLTWATCHTLGLGSGAAYGVVLAAVIIRPDFSRWPPAVFVLVPLVVGLGLGLGTALRPLLEAPPVWQFAVVTLCAQLLAQALPDRLMLARNLIAVTAVLPLLGSNATWLGAWHQLVAVVCFADHHYTVFARSDELGGAWLHYSDMRVSLVGGASGWRDVAQTVLHHRLQPSLLVYADC
jgi:hypothetical protein